MKIADLILLPPPFTKGWSLAAFKPPDTELTFSFLTIKLSAIGIVALILAFGVAAVLFALAWRIATGDFTVIQTSLGKAVSYISNTSKKE